MAKRATKAATRSPAKKPAAGKVRTHGRRVRIPASYDAAQTTVENKKHWANADSLAANALNDPTIRQILRDRARYEIRNNGHLRGMIDAIANDLVGTGPRPQITIPGRDRGVAQEVEAAFQGWSLASDLPEDLRLLHKTKVGDGEGFSLLVSNPALSASLGDTLGFSRSAVTLDLSLYEAEQVHDPWYYGIDPLYTDGIRRDVAGNPIEYTWLENHPGGVSPWGAMQTKVFPAAQVLHWYTRERPGQARGITSLAPGLPLFSQLRRIALAVLGASEVASMIAGVLETDLVAADGSPVEVKAMDEVEFARSVLLTLPGGWKATGFDNKAQPPNYREFRAENLTEAGRSNLVPRNMMTGDSSPYNFSSARLDHLLYQRMIRVDRSRFRVLLDRIWLAWLLEAFLAQALPAALIVERDDRLQLDPPLSTWRWTWHWPGFDSMDPYKDAQTDEIELRNHTTTLAEIYARKGQDWEEQLRQRARERNLILELGLGENPPRPATTPPPTPAAEEDPASAAAPPQA